MTISNLIKMVESSPKSVENTVGKGEIDGHKQFLLFPQCFQKTCISDTSKKGLFGKGLIFVFRDYLHLSVYCSIRVLETWNKKALWEKEKMLLHPIKGRNHHYHLKSSDKGSGGFVACWPHT